MELATKGDTIDFLKKVYFKDKLKNLNKKVTSNKTKYLEVEKKLTDLTTKAAEISGKGYYFLLGRMYSSGDNGYQNVLIFAPVLSSLTLDSNKKANNWVSTGISSEKFK